ncbi:MAG: aminodeoxychorismate synthase component I [Woeseiaceae bacterium]|nr:aminodeoxychorismate synthase component I [Woeseiaceae bacterium]
MPRHGDSSDEVLAADIDLLALHAHDPDFYPYLLQSTSRDGRLGRYDILFANPEESLVLRGDGELQGPGSDGANRFLDSLDRWYDAERGPGGALPFSGGWFVYLGYELAGEIEDTLRLSDDTRLPVAFATRCRTAIIRDHVLNETRLVAEEGVPDRILHRIRNDAENSIASPEHTVSINSIREDEPGFFLDAVASAKARIDYGDIYQANLSRSWHATVDEDTSPGDVYLALCAANPAPFAGLARFENASIISSSPERLIRSRDGLVSTRPIAGTRPRSADLAVDGSLSAELLTHPKERAEHVMLIDLERNDLGRICKPGTVSVDEMMVIETYAHVHHIVSNVSGELDDDVTPGGVVRAVFPGGTITGCPKVKCMEIIASLERAPRGAYTGSFGYLNRDGSLDLNILIRTMVQHDNELTLRAGAGIVADSIPNAELDETRAKAKGLLAALGA